MERQTEDAKARRRKRDLRRSKSQEARSDRYAFVTVIADRETNQIELEHPFISRAEARGVLADALDRLEAEAIDRADSD